MEECQNIATNAVKLIVPDEKTGQPYQKDKVNQWCTQIIDSCIKDLAKLNKPFKYIVTCVIM